MIIKPNFEMDNKKFIQSDMESILKENNGAGSSTDPIIKENNGAGSSTDPIN